MTAKVKREICSNGRVIKKPSIGKKNRRRASNSGGPINIKQINIYKIAVNILPSQIN
jgi:hypothetical protein